MACPRITTFLKCKAQIGFYLEGRVEKNQLVVKMIQAEPGKPILPAEGALIFFRISDTKNQKSFRGRFR